MITDFDLATLCVSIYGTSGTWDHLDEGRDDGVFWGLKKLDGFDAVVFRGSLTLHDWAVDFRAFPIPTRVGTVHLGFFDGMEKMWGEVASMVTQPVMVTGHSLGAARADILGALMVVDGKPLARRAVFGEPKPGDPNFAAFLKDIPGDGYRNGDAHGHDIVTDVPFTLLWDFDFVHPTPLVHVSASPTMIEHLDPLFSYHHVQLYAEALSK